MDSSTEVPIITPTTHRRRSIFNNEGPLVVDPVARYPPAYRNSLESEIRQWTEQMTSVKQERNNVKNQADDEEVVMGRNILGKEEREFFDHSLYHEYLDDVNTFCNILTISVEKRKNRDIMNGDKKNELERLVKKIDEEIKCHILNGRKD